MFKNTAFGPTITEKTPLDNGSVLLKLKQPLAAFPEKLTQKLIDWAEKEPDKLFLARRNSTEGN